MMAKFETYGGDDRSARPGPTREVSATERLAAEYEAAQERLAETKAVWKSTKIVEDRKKARAEVKKIEDWIEDIKKDARKYGVTVPGIVHKEG